MLSVHDAEKLLHTFVTSRLDYSNVMTCKCLLKAPTARSKCSRLYSTKCREHITPVLASLRWLPITFFIDFKLLLITFKGLSLSILRTSTYMFLHELFVVRPKMQDFSSF